MFIAWYWTLGVEERQGYTVRHESTLYIEPGFGVHPIRRFPDGLIDFAVTKCVNFPIRGRPGEFSLFSKPAAGVECGVTRLVSQIELGRGVIYESNRRFKEDRLFDDSQYVGVGWYSGVEQVTFEIAATLAVGTARLMILSNDADYMQKDEIRPLSDQELVTDVIFDTADGRVVGSHQHVGSRDRIATIPHTDDMAVKMIAGVSTDDVPTNIDIVRFPKSSNLNRNNSYTIDLKSKKPVDLPTFKSPID